MTATKTPFPSPPSDLPRLVADCLQEPVVQLVPMAGGLSPRRFFRLERASTERLIVMWLPEDAPERVLARRLDRQLPFLELRALLEKARVRVPRLYASAPEHGVIVVEDLGETLAERCEREPAAREALYRRAVRDLADAQQSLSELPSDCIVTTRRFDRELLTWELEHFREWGIEALGVTLSDTERATFERATSHLVATMLELPTGFVHRDYQSRNLLALPDGSIGWIDFQDALLGPRAYDLVALLCDSYQRFDDEFVTARLADFAARSRLSADDARALRLEFDVITVQRKLKDAGRFVFFERTRGDASYLRFVIPSMRLALAALSRLPALPELSGLAAIVTRQVEIAQSQGMLPA